MGNRIGDYMGPTRQNTFRTRDSYDDRIEAYLPEAEYIEKLKCYLLRDVVYCTAPTNPELECMNIYIPEAYFATGNRQVNADGGTYTAKSAPIIFQSLVQGYSEVAPLDIIPESKMPDQRFARECIHRGMVYVSVGVRGRQTTKGDCHTGKAPALLADAKAAVRFYRHNADVLPGNTEKMFFVGVSAGGNLAALMGVTADHPLYEKKLEQIGACMEESDRLFAVQSYCPITDLENADMAYEWMFGDIDSYGMQEKQELTTMQKQLSKQLAAMYPAYINRLELQDPDTHQKLTLEPDGSGSFRDYMKQQLEKACDVYLEHMKRKTPGMPDCTAEQYRNGDYTYIQHGPAGEKEVRGTDKTSWLSIEDNHVVITDFTVFRNAQIQRMKSCPAFDNLDREKFENEEFGHDNQKVAHFADSVMQALDQTKEVLGEKIDQYAEMYRQEVTDSYIQNQILTLNPLNFMKEKYNTAIAEHFRIRVGSRDGHTSLSVALVPALMLKQRNIDVDFAYVWEKNHGMCDYEGELVEWIEKVAR